MNLSNENAPAGSQLAQGANQNRHPNTIKFTPRLYRLALALQSGPRTIKELADVIPANNPAEYVRQLRVYFGLEIVCERIRSNSSNSESSWFGRYHLTPTDREILSKALDGFRGE